MGEVISPFPQLDKGSFTGTIGARPQRFQPQPIAETNQSSFSEETGPVDQRIAKELPGLRIVKKGKIVLVQTKTGNYTRVFLEKNAILQRMLLTRGRQKRYEYSTRVPVVVRSVKYPDSDPWTIIQGKTVVPFGTPNPISKRLLPEVISRLRPYTKIA